MCPNSILDLLWKLQFNFWNSVKMKREGFLHCSHAYNYQAAVNFTHTTEFLAVKMLLGTFDSMPFLKKIIFTIEADIFPFRPKQKFRPKQSEFSRAFLNSDICEFWDLSAAQFTFSEIFLIAFDQTLSIFGSIYLSHFQKMRQLLWLEKQLATSQFVGTLLAHSSASAK